MTMKADFKKVMENGIDVYFDAEIIATLLIVCSSLSITSLNANELNCTFKDIKKMSVF